MFAAAMAGIALPTSATADDLFFFQDPLAADELQTILQMSGSLSTADSLEIVELNPGCNGAVIAQLANLTASAAICLLMAASMT